MSEGIQRTNTFVSKKVSCVRWRPPTQQAFAQSSQFVSGSWDDEENCVQLWHWTDSGDDPKCVHRVSCQHDITCITYISPNLFATATAGGDVILHRHEGNRLKPDKRWEKLHKTRGGAAPCSWVSAFEDELVTVGDDGRMTVLALSARQPVRVIDGADTCSLYRVQHITHSHVVTANMRGQIKSWDVRSAGRSPTSSVMASQQQSPVTSLARHPTQYHVLASGDGDGVICIWDLREARYPVTELKSHSAEVSDMLFHRLSPDSLFSAGQDGAVCQWNIGTAAQTTISRHPGHKGAPSTRQPTRRRPWLTLDASKRYLDVLALVPAGPFPVNALDAAEDRLVCGGDNEVLHCISQLAV
ncbi:nucleoporin Nup43-like [Pollicipes pollicipes]|uniref:nucleoporin Nup43-like n=1 Tax=Pollicipes pollicipes TaxID=41117 RepID=UPI0018857316|nr:nucleoporin Nup43-like [Pollicipes pollicipes]